MSRQEQDGNALTDPPVYIGLQDYIGFFGSWTTDATDNNEFHLTNYQAVIVKLHATWEANKASAHANHELITALRNKIKKAKRALK